jgi:hypothetical protein
MNIPYLFCSIPWVLWQSKTNKLCTAIDTGGGGDLVA